MAPITPHLAEEAHHYSKNIKPDEVAESSVFMQPWNRMVRSSFLFHFLIDHKLVIAQGDEWFDPSVESEMSNLLAIREGVLKLLEKARVAK